MTPDHTAAERHAGHEPGVLGGEQANTASGSDAPDGTAAGLANGAPATQAARSERREAPQAPAGAERDGEAAPDEHGEHDTPGAPEDDREVAEIEGDLDELVRTAAQRDEYLALAQRTQADFENYRKRVAREAAAAQERGTATLAKELLPALDNLDRALEEAARGLAEDAPEDPLLHGVRLVRSELAGALARAGIESYSPAGEQFDPELHEAVATAPAEGRESGTVVEVYQAGYRHRSGIIRPARVVVAA